MVAPQPATVTQRTVERHFGVPPRMFKQMVRDGLIPTKRIGKLIFAAYEDVKRVVTEGAVAQTRVEKTLKAAVADPVTQGPMSVDAAQAYLDAAGAPREQRQRRKDIGAKAWELMHAHGKKLDDDSPNPKHNEALYEHGERLLLLTMGVRLKSSNAATASASGSAGRYGTCCWCDRPAYATKQSWDTEGWYWCGGPVCEVCAKRRGPNERVVQFEGRRILLPAKDPTVPTSFDAPRRPRKR